MKDGTWIINSNTSDYNLQRVVDEIKLGDEGKGGINLKPFYQRDYKFTVADESLLIESLLGGIPIPLIYLASDTTQIPHITNVIDGQHRLTAINRFLNNKFKLKHLEKFISFNGCNFKQLPDEIQNKLKYQISLKLQFIHTQNDPELELEIFTRYNKGTHPLTKQEIRNVVFTSIFNEKLNEKIIEYQKSEIASTIFNISKKRYSDKKVHQELYVLFGIFNYLNTTEFPQNNKNSIIKNGINQDFYSSTSYVDETMSFFRMLDNGDQIKSDIIRKENFEFLESFIEVLNSIYLNSKIKFPLSKEIFEEVKSRNHKMQTSILMIMVPVVFYILENKINYKTNDDKEKLKSAIKNGLLESDFPKTISSTTEPKLVTTTIEKIIANIK